jgi:hypothetical protein
MGAFRREILEEVGGYDEELTCNEDDELNYRIRAAGYAIILSPNIESYTPPRSLGRLWQSQFYPYGYWKVRVLEKHPGSLQPRHLAPAALIAVLSLSALCSIGTRRKRYLAPVGLYVGSTLAAAGWISRSRPSLTPVVGIALAFMHLGYGTGFLHALLRSSVRSRVSVRAALHANRGRSGTLRWTDRGH